MRVSHACKNHAQNSRDNIFLDGPMATRGYALNKMCFSFNDESARKTFLSDEQAHCDRFGLDDDQKLAIQKRDVLDLIAAGGSIYYLAKFSGIFGLNVQDVGGLQTGQSTEEFQAYLDSQGRGKING